jgi:hypothetical protein
MISQLYFCLFISVSIFHCLHISLSPYFSVYLSVRLSISLFVYLFDYLSLLISLSNCVSLCLSLCLTLCLTLCLSLCLTLCLSLCLSLFRYCLSNTLYTHSNTATRTNTLSNTPTCTYMHHRQIVRKQGEIQKVGDSVLHSTSLPLFHRHLKWTTTFLVIWSTSVAEHFQLIIYVIVFVKILPSR